MLAMTTTCVVLAVLVLGTEGGLPGVRRASVLPFGTGPCPDVPVVDDFSVESYMGTWFEYARFPVPYEALVKCGQAEYTLLNSTTATVVNSGVRELKIAGRTLYRRNSSAEGTVSIPDPSVPAKLVVSFGGQILSYFAKGNYWVLATDYDNYALVYSCTASPWNVFHFDSAWIMTRQRGLTPDNLAALKSQLEDGGVDPRHFFTVDQTDCSVNPDPLHYINSAVRGNRANVVA